MSLVESIVLMLGLIFCVSLLYWSNKKWGYLLSALLLLAAVIISAYWPLMLATGFGLVAVGLLNRYQPELSKGEVRENNLRDWVQHLMALSILLVGIQYVAYYSFLAHGEISGLTRPDVLDAFLPIAAGLEIRAILTLNLWDDNHPAAAVMMVSVLLSGLLCKRAFCGWICPIGYGGTYLFKLRKRFIAGDYNPPGWLDWPLRMLKYLLLAGLLFIIIKGVPTQALPHYLDGTYMKVADLKTGLFFISPGFIGGLCLLVVLLLALWQDRAFCRYLCPYGAALGILSFASPFKVRRNTAHCLIDSKGMDCDKCTRACPARIKVHTVEAVRTDECQACMRCVSACPKKEALDVSTRNGVRLSARGMLIVLLLLMFGLPLIAYLSGFWSSQIEDITRMELMKYLHQINH
ncbi:4Fe-4S binding protein [Vibrio hannami]|uniref:4Fe-4S binding protein n=1 Tax=Vibrio hannami TaxID=2717094 RepID=UPI00240F1EE3|nr:4Fe-4S binding protein [Vibrio hannami]MDG3087727.1 4Fe-4S binding protein [Vibrio hannami]